MLNWIIRWSLDNRGLVLALTVISIVIGITSMSYLPIDAFPDTTPTQVQINTVAPALSPEEVEQQITFPVEQAISGLPGLEQVRSISKFGLSQVVVTFQDGTDIYDARELILQRLVTVELPEGLPRPTMGPVATGLGEVFHYLLSSPERDLTELRTIHDWTVKPFLRTTPGVAEVNSWGGYEKQYQIRIDPTRLLRHDVSFRRVVEAVAANNLNVGGGNITHAGTMLLVHGVARTTTTEQIGRIVVETQEGVPVRVQDLGEVVIGHEIRRGAVTAGGRGEAVLGLGFMLMGENSHQVTRRLKSNLEQIRERLPSDVTMETVYDRTELVDHVIATVQKNLFEGGLFVIAVLFVFLGNLRAGLIVALSIPLSMMFAFAGMLRFGIAGSLLSLGALDFGLVVDSSVIMIENVVRHIAHGHDDGRSRLEAVRDAAIEVREPTMFGELIIMIVYLPILTLEGVEGKLFRPMALTVIFALMGSMVLSLTVMPVLASLLLPARMEEKDPWLVRVAAWLYRPLLRVALANKLGVILASGTLLLVTALAGLGLGSEFVPKLSEGAIVVNVVRLAGTDLDESIRYNTQMERAVIAGFPDEVARVWSRIGTAEVATDPMGVELTDLFITLQPRDSWKKASTQAELVELIHRELRDLPGQRIAMTQPIEMRLNEMVSGVRADVAVKLFGDDFDVLVSKAKEIEGILRTIPGCVDPSTEQVTGQPILRIRLDQDQIARYGIPARDVLDLVESIGSKPLGEIVEGQLRFPLVARLPERYRRSPETIARILVRTPAGEQIPLERLGKILLEEGPSTISREWGRRKITIQCNVRGRDVGGFVKEARKKIAARVELPSSRYYLTWGGQFENLERARNRLLLVVPAALFLIFGLLYLSLGSARLALLVFTGVPLAITGGVFGLWARGMPFSISAAVGFIALSGVAVLNGLVMVTFIRQLRLGGLPVEEAVLQGSVTRLRPILMTALVASLGFLPMAYASGMGAEVQSPLATVVIGGVISSTLLTLFILPALYGWFDPDRSEEGSLT